LCKVSKKRKKERKKRRRKTKKATLLLSPAINFRHNLFLSSAEFGTEQEKKIQIFGCCANFLLLLRRRIGQKQKQKQKKFFFVTHFSTLRQ
jgi:hypothetical protein